MFTRNIRCSECGHEGKVEAHDTIDTSTESEIFKHLGKDPSAICISVVRLAAPT